MGSVKNKKFNFLAFARADKLASFILPDAGYEFVSCDACFTDKTEILTDRGWIKATEIQDDMLIWQVDRATLQGEFIRPKRIIKYNYSGDLINYNTVRGVLTVTEGHRMLFVGQLNHPTRKDKALYRRDIKAGEEHNLTSGCHFACASTNNTVSNWTKDEIDKVCALHADGHLMYTTQNGVSRYTIEVSKPRKVKECQRLFGESDYDCPPNSSQNFHRYTWRMNFNHPLLNGKSLNIEKLGSNQADLLVECLVKWDGAPSRNSEASKRILWTTTKKEEAEKIQVYLVTSGYECSIKVNEPKNAAHSPWYVLSIRKNGCIRFALPSTNRIAPSDRPYLGTAVERQKVIDMEVGCVEVPSGYIQVRQSGQTFITGNCAGEPSIICHLTQDERYTYACIDDPAKKVYYDSSGFLWITDVYTSYGSMTPYAPIIKEWYDRHNQLGMFSQAWNTDKDALVKEIKKYRKVLKIIVLATLYGAWPKKIHETLTLAGETVTLDECQDLFDTFWRTFYKIDRFKKYITRVNQRQGYLINLFGFRGTPAHKDSLNWLIQSSLNGVVLLFLDRLIEHFPDFLFTQFYHDEIIGQIPLNRREEFKIAHRKAVEDLNNDLNWNIPVRFGLSFGSNYLEIK